MTTSYLVSPVTKRALGKGILLNGAIAALGVASLVSTVSGAATVFAPPAAGEGECFAIVDVGLVAATNAITINGNGSLIDGAATAVLSINGGTAMFVRSGAEWTRVLPPFVFSDRDPAAHYPMISIPGGVTATSYLHTHVVNASGATSMFALITALGARGWTKTQDSDGTTYSSAGTRITHSGNGANGIDNDFAWFVLKHPTANRSFCFQRGTNASGFGSRAWRISYCADNAFTAGAPAGARIPDPAAGSVEVILRGGGTPAAPTFVGIFTAANGTFQFHIAAGSRLFPWAAWSETNAARAMANAMCWDPLQGGGFDPADPDPSVAFVSDPAAGTFGAVVNNEAATAPSAFFGALNNVANVRNLGIRTYALGANNLGQSPFSAKDVLGPAAWSRVGAVAGFKGWSTLFQFPSVTTRANMTTLNDGSTRSKIYLTNGVTPTALPWDGTDPGVANFDAETLGPGVP